MGSFSLFNFLGPSELLKQQHRAHVIIPHWWYLRAALSVEKERWQSIPGSETEPAAAQLAWLLPPSAMLYLMLRLQCAGFQRAAALLQTRTRWKSTAFGWQYCPSQVEKWRNWCWTRNLDCRSNTSKYLPAFEVCPWVENNFSLTFWFRQMLPSNTVKELKVEAANN